MTAINRTAYPRMEARLNREELVARYTLTETDHAFIRGSSRGESGRLVLAMLLKSRQDFGCFPAIEDVPTDTVAHLASQLGSQGISISPQRAAGSKSLYRYQAAVREHLSVTPYGEEAEELVSRTTLDAAEVMSDPADLINRAVETLHVASIDLPAFSTLDRLVNRLRAEVHEQMYLKVSQRVTAQQTAVLETLLVKPANATTTPFNRLKQTPGPATPATIRLWVERLKWLVALVYSDPLLEGIAYTKLRQFAAEAEALDVGDLRDIAQTGKRHTLLLALVRQARMRCRDELVKMLLRRMRKTQSAAKEQLAELQEGHREIEEKLIGILGQVLETAQVERSDDAFGRQVRELLLKQGGVESLAETCETVSAWHSDNDLPLLWPIHARYRSLLFELIDLMDIGSATQDRNLLDALAIVRKHRHTRRNDVLDPVDLGFASQRWQSFIKKRGESGFDRRALEVCVFIHLADALQSGDLYVVDAEDFAD